MGLLDIDSDALLGGLLSAGAASGAKGNYLARVAQGLAAGERFKQGRADQARQRSQDEMQAEYKQLMMRKMQMDEAREQRADTQGQTNNAAVLAGLSGGDFDPASFLQKNPGANVSALEQVIKTRQLMQPKASKFSTTPQADQNGRMYVIADDGTMKYLDGVSARDKLISEDLGGKKGFRTEFSPEMVGAVDKTMTFGDKTAMGNLAVAQGNLALSRDRFAFDKTKPTGSAKTGPMSVTLQKELLESDDTVQAAKSVVNTLKQAKAINDKAYSGYMAKGRATLASNLVPGGTDSADATIDLDNMMTGQALESLKVIFGGMPTEGERKILLDMQASADKTPQQRTAIMDRAIAAAERREKFAGSKAKSIRDGSYLTDGVPDAAGPTRTVVKTGMYGGKKVVQYSDGSTEYAN